MDDHSLLPLFLFEEILVVLRIFRPRILPQVLTPNRRYTFFFRNTSNVFPPLVQTPVSDFPSTATDKLLNVFSFFLPSRWPVFFTPLSWDRLMVMVNFPLPFMTFFRGSPQLLAKFFWFEVDLLTIPSSPLLSYRPVPFRSHEKYHLSLAVIVRRARWFFFSHALATEIVSFAVAVKIPLSLPL